MRNFVPLAMDTYFRGNSAELQFCQQVGAGGNHLVVATAAGQPLGEKQQLRLRERELAGVLAEFHSLPAAQQRPSLETPSDVQPPRRPVPDPPPNGLVIRGFCTYLEQADDSKPVRSEVYYYKQNPDRWLVETQSDMLWLREDERKSLLPAELRPGVTLEVTPAIQQRFFSTIGIDYMEGSVNALPLRESRMTLTVERVDAAGVHLRLDGYGHLGKPYSPRAKDEAHSRGCEIRVSGHLVCDRAANFRRFDVVGVGRAWGNKMSYTDREMSVGEEPWMYGIACELVTGDEPSDRIPPYNLLHYNGSGKPYFPKE